MLSGADVRTGNHGLEAGSLLLGTIPAAKGYYALRAGLVVVLDSITYVVRTAVQGWVAEGKRAVADVHRNIPKVAPVCKYANTERETHWGTADGLPPGNIASKLQN
jgi:hypothetical protein